jgi:signal transduction histidine kinase/ligand-binding sensor domain-containing protein
MTNYLLRPVVFVLFFFWAKCSIINAQYTSMKFDYLTTDDGLSTNRVSYFYRDSKGYLWIGTEIGLNKYDGYQIKTYQNIENQPVTLSNNSIAYIFEDRGKNLWCGTYDGLNLYNPATESFTVFRNDSTNEYSLNGNQINGIIEDKKGNLWILTGGNCLNKWIPKSQNFIRYHFQNNPGNVYIPPIKMIAIDSKGFFWIVSLTRGICRFDPETGKIKMYDDPSIDFGNNFAKCLCIDKKDKIWIGSIGGDFYSFDSVTGKFDHYGTSGQNKGLNGNLVHDLIEENDRYLLIAVDQGGINRFDKVTKTFEYIVYDAKNNQGLNNDGVWSLYKDKEGILWVGTSGGGINYYNPKLNKFKLFTHSNNDPNSLSYNVIGCFYEDTRGMIWIGTDGGGLDIYNPKTGIFKNYKHNPSDPYSISGNFIRCIAEDKDHDLWIGTWNAGLNRFDRKTGRFHHYLPDINDPSSVASKITWHLIVDHSGKIWLSSWDNGIEVLDKKRGVIERYRPNPDKPGSLSSNTVWFLYEDNQRNIWVCAEDVLNLYDSIHNSFTLYRNFPDNRIRTIYKDKRGNLWAGSASKGLFLFKPDGEIIKIYDKTNGLPDNTIHAIVEDNQGNIWISTNNGISRFNPKTQKFRNYYKNDGLQGDQFFQQSFLKTRSGEIYFGGYKGFNSFSPDSLKDNDYIPQVYITDFQIFNKPVPFAVPGSPLQKHISETKEIMLSWRQSVFSFSFSAINYTHAEKNQYAYMMEGFEKEWNYTDASRRYVTYTNLDDGEYTFRVKASNNDGIWNEEGVSIKITILPPWWDTWWFRFIIFLTIICLLVSFYLTRVKQLKNQKILLEKLVAQKTAEIQEKNATLLKQAEELNETNTLLEERQQQIEEQSEKVNELNATKDKFFSIIAHDIKNPLNTIMGFSELMAVNFKKWTDEKKQRIVDLILNTSKNLYDLLENLLQWSRSQRGILEFNPEKLELMDLMRNVIDLLKDTAEAKSIELSLIIPKKGMSVHADRQMLHTILRNLISNALKFTKTGGKVQVIAEINDGFAQVKVSDNGVGIRSEIKDKLFEIDAHHTTPGTENEKGTGLGLILAREFVTKHGGEIGVESTVNEGSTFYFTLPLEK